MLTRGAGESVPVIGIAWEAELPSAANYVDRIRDLGIEPITLWPGDASEHDRIDGLVLAGGVDVDPALYGEAAHPETEPPNPERDRHEIDLVRLAMARGVPVLAICRGHQVLNVALGGSLLQHIEGDEHRSFEEDGQFVSRWHAVEITAGSRLAAIYGRRAMEVNSRHHQGVTVERVAPTLRATAFSPDGLVEGLETIDGSWVLGVQWHPERPELHRPGYREGSRPLFEAFVAAAADRRLSARAR